jgi:hypothetical protein
MRRPCKHSKPPLHLAPVDGFRETQTRERRGEINPHAPLGADGHPVRNVQQ